MTMSKLANFAAITALVLGGMFAAAPASAGGARGEVHFAGGRHGDFHNDRHYRGHERHGRYGRYGRRGICQPHEAIGKAMAYGMRRPGIVRVSAFEVVVAGRHRGHRAVLVFDRNSGRCRVLDARGI
jgi:hypothetical protein